MVGCDGGDLFFMVAISEGKGNGRMPENTTRLIPR